MNESTFWTENATYDLPVGNRYRIIELSEASSSAVLRLDTVDGITCVLHQDATTGAYAWIPITEPPELAESEATP